jgi:hypothetical protein
VAGDDLIDAYISELAARLGRWPDADRADVVDELRDHLITSVDTLVDAGESDHAAQQRVLERFGASKLIAAHLRAVRRRRLSDPPRLRHAAALCCALWPAMALGWWLSLIFERTGGWAGPPQTAYLIGTAALILAASLTVMLSVAMARAHGGLGWWGRAGAVFGVAAAGTTLFAWMVPLWGGLLTLAMLSVAIGLRRRDAGPHTPVAAFAAAWVAAALVWCAAQYVATPFDDLLAVSVGACGAALGSLTLRRWLVAAAV